MNDDQKHLAELFLNHLQLERRLSPHTITSYRRDLACLAEYCDGHDVARWQDLEPHHLRSFAANSHAQGLHPRSIQRRLSGVRGFMNYLIREGHMTRNPATDISAPKVPRQLPNTLDVDQMGRLLQIRGDDPVTIRDRAILELLYSSGLRLAELVNLHPEDIDIADAMIRVTGKGNKTRLIPVGRMARASIREWLRVRGSLASTDENALFVGVRGRRISPA